MKQSRYRISRTHTPGPWRIDRRAWGDIKDERGNNVRLGTVIADCAKAFTCVTVRAPETADSPCPSTAELDATGEANARLISAAPELKEASIAAADSIGLVVGALEKFPKRDVRSLIAMLRHAEGSLRNAIDRAVQEIPF